MISQQTETHRSPINGHFLDLLAQGRHRGCSTTERKLRQLATAIREVVPLLDGQATEGLHEWIEVCKQYPTTASDILGS